MADRKLHGKWGETDGVVFCEDDFYHPTTVDRHGNHVPDMKTKLILNSTDGCFYHAAKGDIGHNAFHSNQVVSVEPEA